MVAKMEKKENQEVDENKEISIKTEKQGSANNTLPTRENLEKAYALLCNAERIKKAPIFFRWDLTATFGLTVVHEKKRFLFTFRKVSAIYIFPFAENLAKTLIHEFTHHVLFMRYGFHEHDSRFEKQYLLFVENYYFEVNSILNYEK
jgi:hypothetical protein